MSMSRRAQPPEPVTPVRPQKRTVPPVFNEEPTRQVNNEMLAQLRTMENGASARHEEPTRMAPMPALHLDEPTRPAGREPPMHLTGPLDIEDNSDEATRMASLDGLAALERARKTGTGNDERTRAVDIRNDKSISDIDWDLD
jgi:hypothetical protein